MQADRKKLGIYLHIPFCKSKCAYCDFCSFPGQDADTVDRYAQQLQKDLLSWGDRIGARYEVDTVYFGGGTPTLLPIRAYSRLLEMANRCFPFSSDVEITVECNPKTADLSYLRSLRQSGVNRLSVGVQSADDTELRALGRIHTFADAQAIFQWAHAVGFENISADLMYGIPYQTIDSLTASLHAFADLGLQHLSAYCLKIEEGTPFFKMRDTLPLPDEDEQADMYGQITAELQKIGMERYEISNFAKLGFESRHNRKYWNCEEYLGLGIAAHSFLNGERFALERNLSAYLAGDRIVSEREKLSENDGLCEYVMLRMRLADGVLFAEAQKRFPGVDFVKRFYARLLPYIREGYVIWEEQGEKSGFRFSDRGFFVSNTILADILDFDATEND